MMEQNNPYSTPTAAVSDMQNDDGFGDLKIFTANGRIGRIRYLMYTMGVGLVGMFLAGLMMLIPLVGPFLAIALYVAILVVSIFLTIQRSHDFNMTGWMSLVLLIPIVSLIFYFIPGTKGSNKYGLQPPPNSKAIKITAFLLLAFFLLGIIAAIALPAYQEYAMRAAG
jgi:uncharacterized membrane protein YhaH (DUF805 family)